MIKDSGERREFESGAVRDIQEGKGRCDLLPLDIVAVYAGDRVLDALYQFMSLQDNFYLTVALDDFIYNESDFNDVFTATLELARHFEAGAVKYGERNWEKGIPCHCYVDSAIRHYLKFKRGDKDEPHDRAFIWNIVCLMWTMKHKPECNDLPNNNTYRLNPEFTITANCMEDDLK